MAYDAFDLLYIGVLLLKRNSSVQDLQAYTYAATVFVQDFLNELYMYK
jgi:hypothetical protein